MADILIGNVKGPQGDTGATGSQGPRGDAATITVGTVSTTAYGNTAQVINSGTEQDAVLDFVIPQGKPGQQTTRMGALTLDTITAQSADFPIPAVGETGSTVFGKIIKFFNSTVSALSSKLNISDVVNNLTSTSTTQPLSAAQGKALNDAYTSLKSKMAMGGHSSHPQVPSGANLNSYIDTGTYVVPTDAIAQTITNMPRSASGTLYVLDQGASLYITQIYIPTTSVTWIYVRTKSKTDFSEWRSFNTNSFGIDSFTDTTTGNGNFSHNFGKPVIILSAWSAIGDTIVQSYPKEGTTTSGTSIWWFHIRTALASSSAVANTSVTVTALYMYV